MIRPPPRSTRTATPFPYTTLFRSSVDSSRTGPLLNFPWSRPVAAAAFQRNGNLWLVFDRPANVDLRPITTRDRSEEHTSELQSLMRISYAVFCLKKKKTNITQHIMKYTQQ